MAVTITAAELSAAIRVGDTAGETTQVKRLLSVATEMVTNFAPDAPDVMQNEAVIRIAGFLYDAPTTAYGNALQGSGAGALLLPYRQHRGGVVSPAPVPSGTPGGTAGLDTEAVDERISAKVYDWAESDNSDQIPANKLQNAAPAATDQVARDAASAAQSTADTAQSTAEAAAMNRSGLSASDVAVIRKDIDDLEEATRDIDSSKTQWDQFIVSDPDAPLFFLSRPRTGQDGTVLPRSIQNIDQDNLDWFPVVVDEDTQQLRINRPSSGWGKTRYFYFRQQNVEVVLRNAQYRGIRIPSLSASLSVYLGGINRRVLFSSGQIVEKQIENDNYYYELNFTGYTDANLVDQITYILFQQTDTFTEFDGDLKALPTGGLTNQILVKADSATTRPPKLVWRDETIASTILRRRVSDVNTDINLLKEVTRDLRTETLDQWDNATGNSVGLALGRSDQLGAAQLKALSYSVRLNKPTGGTNAWGPSESSWIIRVADGVDINRYRVGVYDAETSRIQDVILSNAFRRINVTTNDNYKYYQMRFYGEYHAAYGGFITYIIVQRHKTDATVFLGDGSVPDGGTAGQMLAKKTTKDYDLEWVNRPGGRVRLLTSDGFIWNVDESQYRHNNLSGFRAEMIKGGTFVLEMISGADIVWQHTFYVDPNPSLRNLRIYFSGIGASNSARKLVVWRLFVSTTAVTVNSQTGGFGGANHHLRLYRA